MWLKEEYLFLDSNGSDFGITKIDKKNKEQHKMQRKEVNPDIKKTDYQNDKKNNVEQQDEDDELNEEVYNTIVVDWF